MKNLKIYFISICCFVPLSIMGQKVFSGLQLNKYTYNIPKVGEYDRSFRSNPNLELIIGFEIKKLCLSLNTGRQINTLTEHFSGEKPSVWTIENERKMRSQNYIGFGVGCVLFKKRKFELKYFTGFQINKSIKTYYWREAVNSKTVEFVYYDNDLNSNICIKQELLMMHDIFKGASVYFKSGMLNNIVPYDEFDETNVFKNDYSWAYYLSFGLRYRFDLGPK